MRHLKLAVASLSGLVLVGFVTPASNRFSALSDAIAQVSESYGPEDRARENQSYGPPVDPYQNLQGYQPPPSNYGTTGVPSQSVADLKTQGDKAYLDFQNAQNSGDANAAQNALARYQSIQAQLQQLRSQSSPQPER